MSRHDGCVRLAHADDVPLLGVQRTSAVAGARPAREETLTSETDRPRPAFERRPAKDAVFRRIRMFSTVAATSARRDRSLRLLVPASRSRRPHVVHRSGEVLSKGHCKRHPWGKPAEDFERASAFGACWKARAWD
jgi:hypothetical protein